MATRDRILWRDSDGRWVQESPLGGLGMLVHQGALAFERWTGRPAPIKVMRAAAEDALLPAR
jgi:shikimate dehydrogenase